MSAAPHIFTLTGNLLAERTQEFAAWSTGKTQRAARESFQVGGKGVNVAKMLGRLGAPHTALCFSGGATGAECEAWLRAADFSFHAFPAAAATRVGLVVRGGAHAETTFLGPDTAPDPAALRACADFLDARPGAGVLAVCGSFPGWDSPAGEPLHAALRRWAERGTLVADTYGPALLSLLALPLAFVRLNRSELLSLFPPAEANSSTGELLRAARDRWAARRWAVSDGAAPVWFIDERATPETIPAPRVREVSPTGSGDVMLACALHARFGLGLSWRDAVAHALPFAAANAAHPGIADFPLPLSPELTASR